MMTGCAISTSDKPDNDALFQDDISSIHTAGTVQLWFKEHEGEELHLSWPAQSHI
jgi:hypothetical protein